MCLGQECTWSDFWWLQPSHTSSSLSSLKWSSVTKPCLGNTSRLSRSQSKRLFAFPARITLNDTLLYGIHFIKNHDASYEIIFYKYLLPVVQ